MSDDDDCSDDDVHRYSILLPATWSSTRRVRCDCVIEVHPSGSASDTVTHIEAHRAVLASTAYFASLFERADPDRVEQKGADGRRAFRVVYVIEVPFSVDSLAFLVECLYAPRHLDRVGGCDDPIDAVQASLFVGMPGHFISGVIEAALVKLLSDLSKPPNNGGGDDDAVARLGAFVRHLLDGDIDRQTKTFLLEQVLGMLSDGDGEAIAGDHADLVPAARYRPEAVVTDLVTDDEGRRWRVLRIAADGFGVAAAGDASTIVWQGLIFGVKLCSANCSDGPTLEVEVSCTPKGETLGAWPWEQSLPDGTVDAEPRAARFKVRAYHPTRGSHVYVSRNPLFDPDWRKQEERYRARGRMLPQGATLVPFVLHMTMGGTYRVANRVTCTASLAGYEFGTNAVRDLAVCEVEIRVEEIDL